MGFGLISKFAMRLLNPLNGPRLVAPLKDGLLRLPLLGLVEHGHGHVLWQILGPLPLLEFVFIHLLSGHLLDWHLAISAGVLNLTLTLRKTGGLHSFLS